MQKEKLIQLKISKKEYDLVKRASLEVSIPLGTYIRSMAVRNAKRLLNDEGINYEKFE